MGDIGKAHNEYERLRREYGDDDPVVVAAKLKVDTARAKRDETKPLALHVKDAERQQKKADDMLLQLEEDTKRQQDILEAASKELVEVQAKKAFWQETKENTASKLLALRMQQAAATDGSPAGEAPNPEQAAIATIKAKLAKSEQATALLQQIEGMV